MRDLHTRLFLQAIACAACLAWVVPVGAIERSARERQEMAARASTELKAALYLRVPPPRELNALILQGRFAEFEALSRNYEEKFRTDPKYETALERLYHGLDSDDDAMVRNLDTWVNTRRSHISLAARGIYRTLRGFRERGVAFASKTQREQFDRMLQQHRQAIPDLLAALKEDGRFSFAYVALIEIDKARGDTQSAEKVMNEAVRQVPETYYVRHAYLSALQPKWGGDYALMQAYAATLDDAAALNPRIWSLKGEVAAEMARSAWGSRDYAQAIRYYTEALRFGDRVEFLRGRGSLYMTVKDYPHAKADFSRLLEYASDPEVSKSLQSMGGAR